MKQFFARVSALISALIFLLGYSLPAVAGAPTQDLQIILDASGSMRGKINGRTKMSIAKQTLIELAEKISSRCDLAISIRVYGHQSPSKDKNCLDSKLEIPFGPVDPSRIKGLLKKK